MQIDGTANGLRRDWVAIAILTVATIALRIIWWGDPTVTADEQLYALIGSELADGQLPYAGLWDRKPLGLFLLFASGEWISRLTTLPHPIGYQLLAASFALAGALIVYTLARKQADHPAALGSAILFLILISLYGSQSAQSEVFHVPLMLAMLYLLHDRKAARFGLRAALAMIVGGFALQVKYTVAPQCVFFGALALWQLHRNGHSVADLAGYAALFATLGLLPTALASIPYIVADQFETFWFANFGSFFLREPAGRLLPNVGIGLLHLGGLTLAGLYLAWRGPSSQDPTLYRIICGWLIACFATVFFPQTVYAYYLASLTGSVSLVALPLLSIKGPLGRLAMILVVAMNLIIANPVDGHHRSAEARVALAELSASIAPLVDGYDNCLWVYDGPTALYRASGSCLPTRYIYPDHLNNALERNALGTSQLGEVQRILDARPSVIVTADRPLTYYSQDVATLVQKTLRQRYDPAFTRQLGPRTFTVWRHR